MGGAADEREAAAAIAAIEQFIAETTPAPAAEPERINPWQRAALIEGVTAKRLAFPADPGTGMPLR